MVIAFLVERCSYGAIKLTQTKAVLALAEAGSVQTGAKKLGVSPATLMRSIRDLERELGTALIERSGSSIVLTRVGRTFAARAGAAHRELNRARDEILQKLARSPEVCQSGSPPRRSNVVCRGHFRISARKAGRSS